MTDTLWSSRAPARDLNGCRRGIDRQRLERDGTLQRAQPCRAGGDAPGRGHPGLQFCRGVSGAGPV